MQHSPKTIPFTQEAYDQLQQDFDRLTKERTEVIIRLQTAREMGDLSENGAYKYAKFELGNIGRQLSKTKYLLHNGFVQSKTANTTQAEFGSSITLLNVQTQKSTMYVLVSQHESNPAQGKLSTESPLGQAVLHKKVGDEVTATTPKGQVIYQITAIA